MIILVHKIRFGKLFWDVLENPKMEGAKLTDGLLLAEGAEANEPVYHQCGS